MALEVDCVRAGTVALLASERGWESVTIHMDLFGRDAAVLIIEVQGDGTRLPMGPGDGLAPRNPLPLAVA